MISVAEAIAIVTAQVTPLPSERITLAQARGRYLAEDVVADSDLPPFDRSQMDDYALRASVAGVTMDNCSTAFRPKMRKRCWIYSINEPAIASGAKAPSDFGFWSSILASVSTVIPNVIKRSKDSDSRVSSSQNLPLAR
ncbi:MAG TPA: hypothetical protein VIF64_13405 [Pyrinomonadaceae bacterium]|jgi:hypothetical protein